MLRYLKFLLIALFGAALLIVAMANRTMVTVRALPEDLAAFTGIVWVVELPLYLVIFGGMALGVLTGFLWEWLRESRHRTAASTRAREVTRLERELAVMRDSQSVPPGDDVLALLDRKKAG